MLGGTAPYDYLHTFWSDQYEHTIEYVGFAAEWDRLVFRGEPASRKFLGFYLKDGTVRAVVGLDRGGDPEDPKNESELAGRRHADPGPRAGRSRALAEDHPPLTPSRRGRAYAPITSARVAVGRTRQRAELRARRGSRTTHSFPHRPRGDCPSPPRLASVTYRISHRAVARIPSRQTRLAGEDGQAVLGHRVVDEEAGHSNLVTDVDGLMRRAIALLAGMR